MEEVEEEGAFTVHSCSRPFPRVCLGNGLSAVPANTSNIKPPKQEINTNVDDFFAL